MRFYNLETLARRRRLMHPPGIDRKDRPPPPLEKSVAAARRNIFQSRIYKLLSSLVLGLTGFGINFYAIEFDFPPYQATLMPGLVFPMVIALAWGWRYGLVSATLGMGCQTLWFMWLTDGGVEYVITIPMLTLWVVWHGWCSTSGKRRFPLHNAYAAEILFRLANTLLLYILLFTAWQWRPPLWMVEPATGGAILGPIHFRAIEQAVNGFMVLLMANILLSLGAVRKAMGLKRQHGQPDTGYVIAVAFACGLVFWIIDGLVDYYKFREHLRFLIFSAPDNVLDSILFNVSSPDLFARTAFVMTCLAGGALVSRLLRRQHRSAAALKESEVRYRRLHQTMRDAFVQMDMNGCIVDFNHAFQQMLGYDQLTLLSMKDADLTPPEWRGTVADIISEQVLPHGQSEVFEKEYIRLDGTHFPAEIRTFLMTDDGGNPIGMWSIVRDITQRKQIELERELAIRSLQRSNEDLKQFAYVASHDLQEPLRMVASYTQLLAERYEHQLDEKAHRFIHYAVDGATRMQALIRDLLAFSRVETLAREFEAVNAQSAFSTAIANLKAVIDETGALVTADDLPHVLADESQLAQVFQNLIGNGIKFRRPSVTAHIHVSASRRSSHWCFSVQDNGIGIDSKYKDRVFVVFQRLHTRHEYPGTGIGLALCKRIVERHGGRIWFESEPEKGATFYFTLPSTQTQEPVDEESNKCQAY
jgi:PAS domain S-box-containing protein